MKLYKITQEVFNYYRSNVKGNENVTHSLTRRKLTRNIQLAIKSPYPFKDTLELYHYGNLDIAVDPIKHKIVSIRNFKGANCNWFVKDEEMYEKLNKEYKIDEMEKEMV